MSTYPITLPFLQYSNLKVPMTIPPPPGHRKDFGVHRIDGGVEGIIFFQTLQGLSRPWTPGHHGPGGHPAEK